MNKIILLISLLLLSACKTQTNNNEDSSFLNLKVPDINCPPTPDDIAWQTLLDKNCNRLTDYGLFEDPLNPKNNPRLPGLSYTLATELFTDYAHKYRFMFIPQQQKVSYQERSAFDFPVGSVLVKTFVLPESNLTNSANDMVETRLLIRREFGWVGLPYVWNDTKTEAYLVLAGMTIEKQLTVNGVGKIFDYQIPSVADCKTCHLVSTDEVNITSPIGLKARHLNHPMTLLKTGQEVGVINQLLNWKDLGILEKLPEDLADVARLPLWADEARSLQDRAKGYLDINCSHCHTPGGKGAESGMFLEYWRPPESFIHGICKRPGGFNGGDKGLVYDIVPGDAEQSLIPYRMSLLASEGDAKGQMPPLARHLNHVEAIALVRAWIDSMPARNCN